MTDSGKTVARADLIDGLVRGIAVIQAFSNDAPQHTASTLSIATGMSRAAARRFLITLEHLGLAATDGREYWLTPKVLSIAQSYQSSEQLVRTLTPHLRSLSQSIAESVTFGIVDAGDIVFLTRIQGPKLLTSGIRPGTRLPLQCAAAGWALMGHWPTATLGKWLRSTTLQAYTAQTITNKKELEAGIAAARIDGYVMLESQFEIGMRGISVALKNSRDEPIGAISVTMAISACTKQEAVERYVPALKATAERVAKYL
jgi:IclR family transcriptional regulator, pca regulon regulatory protein